MVKTARFAACANSVAHRSAPHIRGILEDDLTYYLGDRIMRIGRISVWKSEISVERL